MSKICFTGGGSGGHIYPGLVVAKKFKNEYDLFWIGSKKKKEMEKKIISKELNIPTYHIPTGKLRRKANIIVSLLYYKNIIDIFNVLFGILSSFFILLKNRPKCIFSKGGFVSVPVLVAAKILKIPSFTHESDYNLGLANKINAKLSTKVFYSFPAPKEKILKQKGIYSGNPIRDEFLIESKQYDLMSEFNFPIKKPILLVLGGSLGAHSLNTMVTNNLSILSEKFNIIHQCGKGKIEIAETDFYKPKEYIFENMNLIMQNSNIIISRSGANLTFEISCSKTPAIYVPLKLGSRGEQVENAKYFENQGVCEVANTEEELIYKIKKINKDIDKYKKQLKDLTFPNAQETIYKYLKAFIKKEG